MFQFFRGVQSFLSLDATVFDDHWKFLNVAGIGIDEIECFAFDDCQGHLAVACKNKRIWLLGNGWEKELTSLDAQNSVVKQLIFRKGDCLLYGVDQLGQFLTWNLLDFKCIITSFPDQILQIDLNPRSPWLIISFKTGFVTLMDCLSRRLSNYIIPADSCGGQSLQKISVNPTNFNLLLLGYENVCILWNFEKGVQDRYELSRESIESNTSSGSLIDLCWEPNGQDFATCYSNGMVIIWTIKKDLLQGLGLKKKKYLHVYETESPANHLEWIQASSSSSFLFVSHSNISRVTRLEIAKEKYDKAKRLHIKCSDIVNYFQILRIHQLKLLLTSSGSGGFQILDSLDGMEMGMPPSLLNLHKGPHVKSTMCRDGFLLINSIKRSREKVTSLFPGGTIYPRNATRNYHILIIFRNEQIEFWHAAIPYPIYLTSIPINYISDIGSFQDYSDIAIHADIKERFMILQTNSKLIVSEFIQHNVDIDDMMDQLDNTMAALEADRSAIKTLSKQHPLNVQQTFAEVESALKTEESIDNQEEKVADIITSAESNYTPAISPKFNEAAIWSSNTPKDSLSIEKSNPESKLESSIPNQNTDLPTSIPKSSSRNDLQMITHDVKCCKTPPLYIANAQWTTTAEISFSDPITSFVYAPKSKSILLTSAKKMYFVNLSEGKVVFESDVSVYTDDHPKKGSSFITHSQFCVLNENNSFLVFSTQSIILFKYKNRQTGLLVELVHVFHCEEEFGIVLYSSGLSDNNKMLVANHDNWSSFVVFTNSSIAIYQLHANRRGVSIQVAQRRDFEETIATGRLIEIEDQCYAVLVFENEILLLSITSLQIVYRVSIVDLCISKSHLSETFICPSGLVGLWLQNNQFKMFSLSTKIPIPSFDCKVYDSSKAKRYAEEHNISFGIGRNQAADHLFAPSINRVKLSSRDQVSSESTGLAGELAKVGAQLAERGEKLDELADRSSQLASASSTFANNVKQLRKAQEKKWL